MAFSRTRAGGRRPQNMSRFRRGAFQPHYHEDEEIEEVQLVKNVNKQDLVKVITTHVKREYADHTAQQTSWQNLPEFPSASEIIPDDRTDVPDLPANPIDRAWNCKEKYVSTHYKLLREDGISPLREAVMEFRQSPSMHDDRDLCVYTQVHIVGYTFGNRGAAPRIEFSYERSARRIPWAQSKRLQQGTLVALCPASDNFKTKCHVAMVAARPMSGVEQNPPQVDLFWTRIEDAEFDPSEEFVMIEARSGYFEATRHMLVAMQKLMSESFPMTDQLIKSSPNLSVPAFLSKQPLMNLNSLAPEIDEQDSVRMLGAVSEDNRGFNNIDVLGPWPTIPGSDLDESQSAALRSIVTKNVSIIQGPPGTGKTFVSICALKVMLDNWQSGDPPIIVAAQTNHALDQLLLLLSTQDPKFLRLGGRTDKDNDLVKSRTLFEVRATAPSGAQLPRQDYKNVRKSLQGHIDTLKKLMDDVLSQSPEELQLMLDRGLLNKKQAESLDDENWVTAATRGAIPNWLGDQLTSPRTCSAMDLAAMQEEEDDLDFDDFNEKQAAAARAFDDDDIEALNGVYVPIKEQFVGRINAACTDTKVEQLLKRHDDMHKIPLRFRGEVYRYLRKQVKSIALDSFRALLIDYERSTKNAKIAKWVSDAYMIRRLGIRLIGCTTTGLSKYRGLLAALKPRTLLIEEAAETTEGMVLAGLMESIQQLVLVGDHQQLQATANNGYLSRAPHNLAVSMFERMIKNHVPFVMLNEQRRMTPEIRRLLVSFYPTLKDHPSVVDRIINRPPVPGMGGRDTYFFNHMYPESREDATSRLNHGEADMIVGFYHYLVLNQLDPSQITILTFYNGQRKLLIRRLRQHNMLKSFHSSSFKVFTVDSYQGEENDVVLLSLVRNNSENSIGFLENKNRAVVSLSRARRGFYMFGNAGNLLSATGQSFDVWGTVTDVLRQLGRPERLDIVVGLPIVCQNHKTETIIMDADQWGEVNGGCTRLCGGSLTCGHLCPYKCHPFSHEEVVCPNPCSLTLPCGHGCNGRCGEVCACDSCAAEYAKDIVQGRLEDYDSEDDLDRVLAISSRPRSELVEAPNVPQPQIRAPVHHRAEDATVMGDTRDWRVWGQTVEGNEALERRIQAQRRAEQAREAHVVPPLVRETYIPTRISSDNRRVGGSSPSRRMIGSSITNAVAYNERLQTRRSDQSLARAESSTTGARIQGDAHLSTVNNEVCVNSASRDGRGTAHSSDLSELQISNDQNTRNPAVTDAAPQIEEDLIQF